jgi:protein-S-isoprenylcysteine O-methyltransferase Ste14
VTSSGVHELVVVAVATCWGVVAAVWIAGAVYNASRAPRARTRAAAVERVPILLVVLAAWLLFRFVPGQDWDSLTVDTLWVRVPGLVLLACSTLFTLWARAALGTMWSGSPTVKTGHRLRTDGPYAVTRHPIYTGLLGMLLGTTLLVGLGHWLVIFPLAVLFAELRIRAEEQLMLATFPEAYPDYRRRVPQLVPGLRGLVRAG